MERNKSVCRGAINLVYHLHNPVTPQSLPRCKIGINNNSKALWIFKAPLKSRQQLLVPTLNSSSSMNLCCSCCSEEVCEPVFCGRFVERNASSPTICNETLSRSYSLLKIDHQQTNSVTTHWSCRGSRRGRGRTVPLGLCAVPYPISWQRNWISGALRTRRRRWKVKCQDGRGGHSSPSVVLLI